MSHLSPAEFVDLLEQRLPPDRVAHVQTCTSCRGQADLLRAVMTRAHDADVPEPSPLFWDHLSARVRQAIVAEPNWKSHRLGWLPSRLAWRAGMAAMVLLTLATAVLLRAPSSNRAIAVLAPGVTDAPEHETVLEEGEEWTFVAGVAEGADWDEVVEGGLYVRPGAAERALLQLSADERRELARLIESELLRSKS